MAGRLTPGALGWRKAGNAPVASTPRVVVSTPPGNSTGVELDHTDALERWASTAHERPSWMAEPELRSSAPAEQVPHASTAALVSPAVAGFNANPLVSDPEVPAFDEATDRFALFAERAAEARSFFTPDDYVRPPAVDGPPAPPSASGTADSALVPAPTADVAPVDAVAVAVAVLDATTPRTSPGAWRPDDVQVSAAEMDADAMRLETLAARAVEMRESRGDFAMPAIELPFTPAAAHVPDSGGGWRRDTVAVSAEEFDADAARLEMLASRAAEWTPPSLDPEPVAVEADEHVAFWRKDAAVVTAEEFDADAARLESLAARGPLFAAQDLGEPVEATPFWEQQERLRAESEQTAAAAAAAREATANDEWHTRWERVAEEAARRGEIADPLTS